MNNKIASYPGGGNKLCARIDIRKASVVGGVELGEEVVVTVTGRVKALRGPDEYLSTKYDKKGEPSGERKETCPGTIEVEISSMKVVGKSEFDPEEEDY